MNTKLGGDAMRRRSGFILKYFDKDNKTFKKE